MHLIYFIKNFILMNLIREQLLSRQRIKESHRKIMLANHPDRGGSVSISMYYYKQTYLSLI